MNRKNAPIIIPHDPKKSKREKRMGRVFFEKKSVFRLFFLFCIDYRPFHGIERIACRIRLIFVRRTISVTAICGPESGGTPRVDVRPVVADHPRESGVRTSLFQYMIKGFRLRFQRKPGIRPDDHREKVIDAESLQDEERGRMGLVCEDSQADRRDSSPSGTPG